MTRVYLMADFGKGPRCYRYWATAAQADFFRDHPRDSQTGKRFPWWLVESESSDAARMTISEVEHVKAGGKERQLPTRVPLCPWCPFKLGLILDSGGQS